MVLYDYFRILWAADAVACTWRGVPNNLFKGLRMIPKFLYFFCSREGPAIICRSIIQHLTNISKYLFIFIWVKQNTTIFDVIPLISSLYKLELETAHLLTTLALIS